jgi:hypothetical protein
MGATEILPPGWRDLVTPCVSLPTQTPVNLGCMPDGINSAQDDDAPNYFEDEEPGIISLYFASTRQEGRPVGSPLGSEHIYVSILGDDGSFGPAVLVPELSSTSNETRVFSGSSSRSCGTPSIAKRRRENCAEVSAARSALALARAGMTWRSAAR